jgi:glycerol-3-phosphate dehydrogenase
MQRNLTLLAQTIHDVLVIGGGIVGAGVARDAARRGLAVALVEKEDFGCGTTSRSTRLIHGGLRYLEERDFGLVREALREREILLRIAPHLVCPLPFLTPLYDGGRWSPGMVGVGMLLYDLLSYDKSLPNSRMLRAPEVMELEPGLRREGLRGGALYYDAQIAYPERLCVDNLLDAAAHGAQVANHARVVAFLRDGERIAGAVVEDALTGDRHEVQARFVVNAAGPWADAVATTAYPPLGPKLRLTEGVHLIVPRFTEHAIVLLAQRDGRVFFVIPWAGMSLIGTTDTDFDRDLDTLAAQEEDVQYLVEETHKTFPQADLDTIHYTTTGIRALVRQPTQTSPGATSRQHRIIDHASAGAPGLISVYGGKITVYRHIAEQVTDLLCRFLKHRARCDTHTAPLPGAAIGADLRASPAVGTGLRASPETEESEDWRECLRHALAHEMVCTSADFLLRRTELGLRADLGRPLVEEVAREIGAYHHWNEAQIAADMAAYREVAGRMRRGTSGGKIE